MKALIRCSALFCASLALGFGDAYNLVDILQGTDATEIQVFFGPKMPTESAAKDVNNWSVRKLDLKSGAMIEIPVKSALPDIPQKEVSLTLESAVDFNDVRVTVTFLQGNFPVGTSSEPMKTGASAKFAPAKGSKDADIYLSGSVTASEKAKPGYALEARAGYLFDLGKDGRYGALGPSSEVALNETSDPNHLKAAVAYDKVFPMASSAGWIFHWDVIGGEFDRRATTKNLVTGLNMTLVLPSARLGTHTFVTADISAGFEGGKNYEVPNGGALGAFDRKLLGATGYYLLLHPGKLDRITLTGDYQVRLPSTQEPFVPSGADAPIFTSKPRHHAAVDLNVMFSKALGATAQYRWGSLPPLFQFVDNSVVVGLVLQLKQAN